MSLKFILKKQNTLENKLKKILNISTKNIQLYITALTHKSFAHQQKPLLLSNERLEFLGDSILNTITSEYLYNQYPNKDEGSLSIIRSKIINRHSLNQLAYKIKLDTVLRATNIGKSENVFGNALEALIAAIFIDKGYNYTKNFVIKKLFKFIDLNTIEKKISDFKTLIIDWAQKNNINIYFNTYYKKPPPNTIFISYLYINQKVIATGEASSKKESEQHAAKQAYYKIFNISSYENN